MYIVFFHCKPPGYSSLAVIWWISFVTSVSMQSEFQINFKCASLTFGHLDTVNRTQSTKQTVTMVIGWRLIFMPRSFEKVSALEISQCPEPRNLQQSAAGSSDFQPNLGCPSFFFWVLWTERFLKHDGVPWPSLPGLRWKKKSYVSEKFPTSSWPLIYYLLSYMYICFFFVVNIPLLYVYRWCINLYIYIYTYFYNKYCVHDILYFYLLSRIHLWLPQMLTSMLGGSSWWQIDDDFGGNSPSRNPLFVFCWVRTWKRICWGQGASLLSIRCQESERLPYHKKGTIV